MKCFFCNHSVPAEAKEANFCVECGRPLTQLCPYPASTQGVGESHRLPLCDENGRATAVCPHPQCGGLFKACAVCHRLNKLDSVVCQTGCEGALLEPIEPFPSPDGALDGRHCVRFYGGFARPQRVGAPQEVELLQALAFRYGLLIGIGRRQIFSWEWANGMWRPSRNGQESLQPSGELRLRSLIVEQGHVFALGEDRALVFNLMGGIHKQQEQMGRFTRQTASAQWWARASEEGEVLITNAETWNTRRVSLPPGTGRVMEMVAYKDAAYLAGADGNLVRVDALSGEARPITRLKMRWARLAAGAERILALGYDVDDNRLTLAAISADGQTVQSQRKLQAGALADFVWIGDSVYVVRLLENERNLLEIYDAGQLSADPRTLNLKAGIEIQPGLLGLMGASDETQGRNRLLLRCADISNFWFYLCDPQPPSGRLMELGPYMDRPSAPGEMFNAYVEGGPLLCVADSRLIVAARERNITKLHTFVLEETP